MSKYLTRKGHTTLSNVCKRKSATGRNIISIKYIIETMHIMQHIQHLPKNWGSRFDPVLADADRSEEIHRSAVLGMNWNGSETRGSASTETGGSAV
jgi:vacuolar-type H+-ATPase subunit B/Vma2